MKSKRYSPRTGVGDTPLLELRNITALARKYAKTRIWRQNPR